MKADIHFWSYLTHFFLEWEMFQKKAVDKIITRILCSVNFFLENPAFLWYNVEKYYRKGQAKNDNKAHTHCTLDT
jgi:hypothetical protein